MTTEDPTAAAARRGRRAQRSSTVIAAAVAALLAHPQGAMALSLGELRVASHLGEPLRAELALGVSPGERVSPDCIHLATDATAGARSGVRYDARLQLVGSAGSQRLLIEGRSALREPLMELVVAVNCPGTPVMQRVYALMLTPAAVLAQRSPAPSGRAESAGALTAAATPPAPTATTRAAARSPGPVTAATRGQAEALATGQRYQVRPGDTLSTIAQRVGDRQGSLWQQAESIFAANPDAFINGDRNRIRAGASILIPDAPLLAGTPAPAPSERLPAPAATEAAAGAEPQTAAAAPASTPPPAAVPALPAAPAPAVGPPALSEQQRWTQALEMGPPLPERLATAQASSAPAPVPAMIADARAERGMSGWLAGLLVGIGFMGLGGLLAWAGLRRRPEAETAVDLEATERAVQLAPPPSFDPELQATRELPLRSLQRDAGGDPGAITAEVEVLEMDAAAPAAPTFAQVDALLDEPARASGKEAGDTTVTHRFSGFSETEALDLQMAEAMAMLERDYTSRFEAAVSHEETARLDATDTLHGLPAEVTRSLEELRTASERGGEEAVDENEPTALLQPPQERFGTG